MYARPPQADYTHAKAKHSTAHDTQNNSTAWYLPSYMPGRRREGTAVSWLQPLRSQEFTHKPPHYRPDYRVRCSAAPVDVGQLHYHRKGEPLWIVNSLLVSLFGCTKTVNFCGFGFGLSYEHTFPFLFHRAL